MSTRIIPPNDGGPAFPMPNFTDRGEHTHWGDRGMTLRDWFAGQALIGVLSNHSLLLKIDVGAGASVSTREAAAIYAYGLADSMLTERNKGDAK